MRNYLIVVEGAHDIAVVEKLLRINGVREQIRNAADLPKVWEHTIPTTFPFHNGRLDRITPIPSFVKNQEISVAIKNANSDSEIMTVLWQLLNTMLYSEKDQLDGIMLICDADNKKAQVKIENLLSECRERDDFRFESGQDGIFLDLKVKKVPVYLYAFPDNSNEGNLENLLLETAQVVYPELLNLADQYIEQASAVQSSLKKEQLAKKAKVGCIANVMKPGKANQVSIADDEWISEKTLKVCEMLKKLNCEIMKMIFSIHDNKNDTDDR